MTNNEILGYTMRICKYFATEGRDFAARVEVDVSIVNGLRDSTVKRRNVKIDVANYHGKKLLEELEDREEHASSLNSDGDDE